MSHTLLPIRTMLYHPPVDGMAKFNRYATYGELTRQVEATLKSIPMPDEEGSAYSHAEWISPDRDIDESSECKQSKLIAAFDYGNCEGFVIRILSYGDQGIKEILTIKYLSGEDSVWAITKSLAQAINEGCFF